MTAREKIENSGYDDVVIYNTIRSLPYVEYSPIVVYAIDYFE